MSSVTTETRDKPDRWEEDGQPPASLDDEPRANRAREESSPRPTGVDESEPPRHEPSTDQNPEPAPSPVPKKRPIYKRPVPRILGGLAIVAVAVGLWLYLIHAAPFETTDDAFLEGNLVQIAPQVAGPIAQLPVDTNDQVSKGDLLVQIDPSDYKVALAAAQAERASAAAMLEQARSNLSVVKAGLSVAKAGVEQSQAKVEVARTNQSNARSDLDRYQQVDPDAVPQRKIDNARDRVAQMKAQMTAAKQKAASTRADVKSAQARIKSAQAKIDTEKAAIARAQTQIDKAKLKLSYTSIRAPADGQIAKLNLEEGEYVQPGQAMMALVPTEIWVKANFKETQIAHMRPGQPVEIEIDAYPGQTFDGHVQSLQRGTGSEFSLLPPQNATGNFVKVVQRLPVKIVFDEHPRIASIAPGMSAQPSVKVREFQWWPWWPSEGDRTVQGQKPTAGPATYSEKF